MLRDYKGGGWKKLKSGKMRATRLIEKLSRKVVTERVKLRQLPRRFSRRPLRRRGGVLDGEGVLDGGGGGGVGGGVARWGGGCSMERGYAFGVVSCNFLVWGL